jgi:adenosine/AMP kinase
MILKYFRRKKSAKNGVFLLKATVNYAKICSLVRKLGKYITCHHCFRVYVKNRYPIFADAKRFFEIGKSLRKVIGQAEIRVGTILMQTALTGLFT